MAHLTELENLKSVMRETTEFSRAWNQFFDLTEMPGFVDVSEPDTLEYLAAVFERISDEYQRGAPGRSVRNPAVMRYPGSDFYHGTVDCTGCLGAFMYFQDIDQGMLALTDARSLNTVFFRFTLAFVDGKSNVVLPTPQAGDPTVH